MEYLQSIKGNEENASESGDEESDESDGGDDIADKLRRDRLASQGKYFRYLKWLANVVICFSSVAHALEDHNFSKIVLSGHEVNTKHL